MKVNFSKAMNSTRMAISKHSPEILTGLGVAGMITTVIFAVKATPKAMECIKEAEEEKGEELTKVETVKATWKCYIPTAVSGVVSTACIIGSNSVNAKRNAALATAYKLTEAAFIEYKDKVVETIGEKGHEEIKRSIAKDKVEKKHSENNQGSVVVATNGNVMFHDAITGRDFQCTVSKIRAAVNEINRTMTYDMYVSLNDFYEKIGLERTGMGDLLGWNLDNGLVDIWFDTVMTKNDEPCIVIDYSIEPRYDFSKLM